VVAVESEMLSSERLLPAAPSANGRLDVPLASGCSDEAPAERRGVFACPFFICYL